MAISIIYLRILRNLREIFFFGLILNPIPGGGEFQNSMSCVNRMRIGGGKPRPYRTGEHSPRELSLIYAQKAAVSGCLLKSIILRGYYLLISNT
jgi:hypothetical protein